MRQVTFPDGVVVPALGQGTWRMGEVHGARSAEVSALRRGLELGMTLVDTAEMYGEGGAEEVLGEALRDVRDRAFVVSKVYPHNAGARAVAQACERSLRRLRIDSLDLYLLHWRGDVPLEETVAAFERLRAQGKIARWGVSNFDTDDMEELWAVPDGQRCATNQILYNLGRRGPEHDLLPWLGARGLPVMAYSPIEQGRLPRTGVIADVARNHGATPSAVALAWLVEQPGVIAIPKASDPAHVEANARAADLRLGDADRAALDAAFPPPTRKVRLAML